MPTRNEYKIAREHYEKTKEGLLRLISIHEDTIKLIQKQLEESRPGTENGKEICPKCDCISMKYEGRKKVHFVKDVEQVLDYYTCEICNYEYSEDLGLWRGNVFVTCEID